jgi:hypothetical protein
MKKVSILLIFLALTSVVMAQKTITYEEMKTITKGAFENIECDVYQAKDGFSYKVGDTLKIGRPSSNKTFAFITTGGTAAALSGQAPEPLSVNSSGTNTVIKKIAVGGSKRMGFKIYVVGKGICGICPNNNIDFEEAIATGEIQSKGMSREQAISKLKEAKDLVDLGMMSKEDFEKLKLELTPIIIKN